MVKPPPGFGGGPNSSGSGRRSLLDVDESEVWAPGQSEQVIDDFAARFEQATADLDALSLADLSEPDGGHVRGEREAPVDAASIEPEEEKKRRYAEAARSQTSKTIVQREADLELADGTESLAPDPEPEPAPSRFAPPAGVPGEDDLQLDFDAAGMSRPGVAMKPALAAPVAPVAPPSASMPTAALVPSAPMSMVPAPAPAPEHDSLLGVDRLTAGLIGLAIGLVVGLFPAMRVSRSMIDKDTRDLMVELEDAVSRPLAVRAGEVREPAAIAGEIRRAYEPAQSRYFLVWLGVALPFGVVFALLRRRQ